MPSSNIPFAVHRADLTALAAEDRRRALTPRTGIDFASNDYLGLAGSAALRDALAHGIARGLPAGSGGPRLLRRNHDEHDAPEAHAARHYVSQVAVLFAPRPAAPAPPLATLRPEERRVGQERVRP